MTPRDFFLNNFFNRIKKEHRCDFLCFKNKWSSERCNIFYCFNYASGDNESMDNVQPSAERTMFSAYSFFAVPNPTVISNSHESNLN